MTTSSQETPGLPPNILDLIETGEIVAYHDFAGRGYTIRELINAKRAGTFLSLRKQLTRTYDDVAGLPLNIELPNLSLKSVTNQELVSALGRMNIPYMANDQGPRLPSLFPVSDAEMLAANYESAISTESFNEAVLSQIDPEAADEELFNIMPNGLPELNKENTRRAAYVQPMRNVPANKQVYTALRQVISLLQDTQPNHPLIPRLKQLCLVLMHTAKTHFFGTGSPLGQLGRIKKGHEVRAHSEAARQKSTLWPYVRDYNNYRAIQDAMRRVQHIPTNDRLDINPVDLLQDPVVNVAMPGQDTVTPVGLIHITRSADAGYPWDGNKTKGETTVADILILQKMFEDAAQLPPNGQMSPREFRKKWGWTTLHKIKAKAEIYEVAKLHTKVRNISVPCNCVMILPQMALKLAKYATSSHQNKLDPECANTSMMGYKPFKQGHELFLGSATTKRQLFHYADNLYIFEGDKFCSIDVTSMEATHDTGLATFSSRYILEKAFGCSFDDSHHVTGGGSIGILNAWLIHEWFTPIVCQSPGVLRSFIVEEAGLKSGMPPTFTMNDQEMAIAAYFITLLPDNQAWLTEDGTPTPPVQAILDDMGLLTKNESYAPGKSPTLKQAAARPWNIATEDPTFSNTDILGFDTIYVSVSGVKRIVPVLNKHRLIKALSFNKSELRTTPLSPIVTAIVQMATLNVLYLSGGWAYIDLALAIEATCAQIMADISLEGAMGVVADTQTATTITTEALARAVASIDSEDAIDQSMAKGMLKPMLGSGLVPLTLVFKLIHSQELADELTEACLSSAGEVTEKLMRFIGPAAIAENHEQIRQHAGRLAIPTINRALRALDTLVPLMEHQPGPSTSSLDTPEQMELAPTTPGPPAPLKPIVPSKRRAPDASVYDHIRAELDDTLQTVDDDQRLRAELALALLERHWEETGAGAPVPFFDSRMDPDNPGEVLIQPLANLTNTVHTAIAELLPDINRLVMDGALIPEGPNLGLPPPSKRRATSQEPEPSSRRRPSKKPHVKSRQ